MSKYLTPGRTDALKDLEKCGPKPCKECPSRYLMCEQPEYVSSQHSACGPYARWLGQQEGYAKGLAKGSWNVVEQMKNKARGMGYDSDWEDMALEMALWLKQSGIPEPPDTFYCYDEVKVKTEAESRAEMAREIVEWLEKPEEGPARHIRQGRRRLTASELRKSLKEKGVL